MAVVTLSLSQLATSLRGRADALDSLVTDTGLKKVIQLHAQSGVKEHFNQGVSPEGVPWAPLKIRSGKPLRDKGLLMASIQATQDQNGLTLSSNRVGAALHQYGGTITPKSARFLAIPVSKEAQRAGSPRNMAGLSPRINKAKTGGVLVNKKGKVHYALTKKVVVPARPFLGFSVKTLGRIEKAIQDKAAKVASDG